MHTTRFLLAGLVVLLGITDPPPAAGPAVIAHRGASGHLPEHTLEAYTLAHAQGADYLEPDLVLTADDVLVCGHDLTVRTNSDVAERFPDRVRDNGGWYIADFTWAELSSLRIHDNREPPVSGLKYASFDEMLQLLARLNAITGRTVGVMAELKSPALHRKAGHPMEEALLQTLARYGYTTRDDPVVIQCFEESTLVTLRERLGSDLKLLLLTDTMPSAEDLDRLARFADALGPSRKLIEDGQGRPVSGRLVQAAHERGLAVYPWTFVDEVEAIHRFFTDYDVDGVFADYPDVGVAAREKIREQVGAER